MSIQEEITALLNGELADEARVAELMHVLAVSPEKRQLLVEQIRMSRGYSALGSSVTPPGGADERIWQGIHAIDAGFAPLAAAVAPGVGMGLFGRIGLMSMLGLLLAGLGLGTGYLLGCDYAVSPPELSRSAAQEDPTFLLLATAQDSLDASRRQIQDLGTGYDRALATIGELQRTDSLRAATLVRQNTRVVELEKMVASLSRRNIQEPPRVIEGTRLLPPPPGEIRLQLIDPLPRPDRPEIEVPGLEPKIETPESVGPFQVGLRQNFRLSLPRVYGLSTPRPVWRDNEFVATLRLGDDDEVGGGTRLGVAAGETQFSQIFHSNKDDVGIDQIIRQSPALFYARGFIAPQLGTLGDWNASLEFGGGGTEIGPIGTGGVNVQYALPSSMLVFNGGVSAWMLWSSLDGETYTSTNLNAYFGASIAF